MSKDKNNKTTCTKKKYRYTAAEVAGLAACSEGYVKNIRSQMVELNSPLAQKVIAIDELLYDGGTTLLKEVERVLKQA